MRPLYLVLDDLHTSDPSSLALLHFVARNLRGLRALIVGAYRPEEAQVCDRGRAGCSATSRARGRTCRWCRWTAGRSPSSSRGFRAARRTRSWCDRSSGRPKGNPLFVDELLRLLVQRGDFGATAGAALPVPDTVREVIRKRLARLPADARELLGAASVLGRDFDVATLAALTKTGATACGVRWRRRRRRTSSSPPRRARFAFRTCWWARPCTRICRRRGARRCIWSWPPCSERAATTSLAEVAHHRLAALPAGDPARGRERGAARGGAGDGDAGVRGRGRAAGDRRARLCSRRAGWMLRESFELRLRAGLAFMRAGQGDRGRALCAAAADEARRLGDGDSLARAALSYGAELMLAQTNRTLIDLLTEALGKLPPGPSGTRAQVMARLASARDARRRIRRRPMQMARDAVAMARAVGADDDVMRAVLYLRRLGAGGLR